MGEFKAEVSGIEGSWIVGSRRMIKLSRANYEVLLAQARAAHPLEACGLMAGRDGCVLRLYPITNELASPYAYEMAPQEQIQAMLDIEDRDWELLAIYHSHPHGPKRPSSTDIATAYYPDAAQVIISLAEEPPAVRAYFVVDGDVSDVPMEVG